VWWVRPPDPIEPERFSCEVVQSTRNGRIGQDHKFRSHGPFRRIESEDLLRFGRDLKHSRHPL
jgi:hypothetical protein